LELESGVYFLSKEQKEIDSTVQKRKEKMAKSEQKKKEKKTPIYSTG